MEMFDEKPKSSDSKAYLDQIQEYSKNKKIRSDSKSNMLCGKYKYEKHHEELYDSISAKSW